MKKLLFLLITIISIVSSLSVKAATSERITLYIDTITGDVEYKNKNTRISLDNGIWTIDDFVGSGTPLSFKFDMPNENGYAKAIITSNTIVENGDESFPFLLDHRDEYVTCSVTPKTQTLPYAIHRVSIYTDDEYPYVFRYANGSDYDFYLYMEVYGYNSYNMESALVVWTFFDKLDDAGIADVTADNDAPVIYYDLQGREVRNPSGGIYIRRQGNEIKKVFIR